MKYQVENISKTIAKERKKLKNVSQSKLGEMINVSGKQISNYENGKLLPPIDIMLKLCEVFNCELGYLLGEETYANGTKTNTIVSNVTGLSVESINAITQITGTEKHCIDFGYESEKYRRILNSLLISKEFYDIMELLSNLDDIYKRDEEKDNLESNLKKELGEELFNKALENCNIVDQDEDADDFTLEEQNAIIKAKTLIDNCMTMDCNNKHDMAYTKFRLQEKCTLLLNRLYPLKD